MLYPMAALQQKLFTSRIGGKSFQRPSHKLKAKPTRGGVLIGVHLANSASKRKASQRRPILSITKIRGTRLSSQHSTSLNHCEQEELCWRFLFPFGMKMFRKDNYLNKWQYRNMQFIEPTHYTEIVMKPAR
ncbi:hypothetical protein GQX74_014274 [Glossina fuscipes]|nr:hypothetical protein GQX74_014274 [Glossina fuscipes]